MTTSAVRASTTRFSPYRSTGKAPDSETGKDYFGARCYCTGMGRFLSPDWAAKPISVGGPHFPALGKCGVLSSNHFRVPHPA